MPIMLLVSRMMQLASQSQNKSHRMMTDRIGIYTAGVCHPNSPRA